MTKRRQLFSQKTYIINVRHVSKYASKCYNKVEYRPVMVCLNKLETCPWINSMKQVLSVLVFSVCFIGIGSLVFSKFWNGFRNRYEIVRGRAVFFEKNRNMDQNHGFIDFIELFGLYFFVNLVYNESFYYLLYSYTNLISGKNLGPCQIGLPLPNFRPLFSLFTD